MTYLPRECVVVEDAKDRRIAELEQELAERDRRLEKLERKIEQLERINEELRRAGKRQTTPFIWGEPKQRPRRWGRKSRAEYGTRASREAPKRIDRMVHVPAPLYCPECDKPAKLTGRVTQW